MKIQKLIASLAVLVFAGSALAQTTTTTTTTTSGSPARSVRRSGSSSSYDSSAGRSVASGMATTRNEAGWIPSVGLGFGHLDQSGNSGLDGDFVTAELLGTWYFQNTNWLADAGLGVQKQYFRDAQPTSGLITASGRYQFPQRWSIGPVVDLMIGTTGEYGTSNRYLTTAGVQGLKEITFANDQLVRLGLKYATEFGISGQTSNFFGVIAQWGVGANNPVVRSAVSMNE